MASEPGGAAGNGSKARSVVSAAFARVQDVVYVGLGVLLAITAVSLLVHGGVDLLGALREGDVRLVVSLLDRTLLTLMLIELLYTVQVSFGEHVLRPEPFILIALIAAVRRVLVITAEIGGETRPEHLVFNEVMLELGLLTVLVIVLVVSLAILHRKVRLDEDLTPAAHRAGQDE
jgi:hypothetical protein